MSMTINPDDAPYENTSESFWEVKIFLNVLE